MGTRGTIGFYKDGVTKACYNHFDSYPSYLGANILKELKTTNIKELNKAFDNIKLVDGDTKPTKKQQEELKQFSNTQVSKQTTEDWYCLLREIQGTLTPYIKGKVNYMLDAKDFIKDSLFCEWGYIVNLDTEKLEVWQGFQSTPNKNRYSLTKDEIQEQKKENTHREEIYYACERVAEYDLEKLPQEKIFLMDLGDDDE